MIEHAIIKLFVENSVLYDKYYKHLKIDDYVKINYPILYRLFKCLPVNSLSELEAVYLTNYPVIKEGDREVVTNMIKAINAVQADETAIISYLEMHKTQAISNEIAITALEVAQGQKSKEHLTLLYEKLEQPISIEEEQAYITTDLDELLEEDKLQPGLTWRLKCLNQSLGPLRKGDFGHIFARVETGKTAMWVSEVTHFMKQVDKPILIFFNEEGGKGVVFRMYNAATKMSYMELRTNPKHAKRVWQENGGDYIKFVDDPSLVEKKYIERTIEEMQPALVIIDNMDKVKGFSADREDMRLHEIYKWGRELAKTYCPVISVGQADATGHNSKWIDEAQMANSKTGKPSELDFIIGIGRVDKEGYEDVRYINIPKNKLRGDNNTLEGLRHGKFEVLLKPSLSLYEDM